jgi:hypothetical protein
MHGAPVAEPRLGAGALANRQRWRTAIAGCTVGPRPAHRGVTGVRSSMASTQRKRWTTAEGIATLLRARPLSANQCGSLHFSICRSSFSPCRVAAGVPTGDSLFHWAAALPSSPFRAIGIGCIQHLVRIPWEDTKGSPSASFTGCRGASPNGQLDQGIAVRAFGTQLSGADDSCD